MGAAQRHSDSALPRAPAMDDMPYKGLQNVSERTYTAMANSFFNRFDADGSNTINSVGEFRQLVTNLVFHLKIPNFVGEGGATLIAEAVASRNVDKEPISKPDFVDWFRATFLADNDGGGPVTTGESLKLLCTTWNVGNAMPVHDLT